MKFSEIKLILLSIFLMILVNCTGNQTASEKILAKVGNITITADEFEMNYNFGPSKLKPLENSREKYLDAMINEILLYHKVNNDSLANTSFVTSSMQLIEQELLIEKVYEQEVDRHIEVSDEEIREEFLKASKSVKVAYLYTPDPNEAFKLISRLDRGEDFDAVAEEKLSQIGLNIEVSKTAFIKNGDLPEPFNSIIFSLKPGEYSDIIQQSNGFYIIKLIDERLEIMDEKDLDKYYSRYHKIVRYKKLLKESNNFVKDFMEPRNIAVDRKVFEQLAKILYPLYNDSENIPMSKDATILPTADLVNQMGRNLESLRQETLVRHKDGELKVDDLVAQLSFRPVRFYADSEREFAGKLKTEIGFILRDYFIAEEGKSQHYDEDEKIVREINNWRQKLVVRQYMDNMKDTSVPTYTEAKEYFQETYPAYKVDFNNVAERVVSELLLKRVHEKLEQVTAELRKTISVEIDTVLLQNMELDEPKYGKLPDVKVFKLGLPYLRPAVPTPDELWGF